MELSILLKSEDLPLETLTSCASPVLSLPSWVSSTTHAPDLRVIFKEKKLQKFKDLKGKDLVNTPCRVLDIWPEVAAQHLPVSPATILLFFCLIGRPAPRTWFLSPSKDSDFLPCSFQKCLFPASLLSCSSRQCLEIET